MKIRKLTNDDQQALETFLYRHIESSLFMLSNSRIAGLEFHGRDYQGDYYAAFSEENELTAVLAHYWNGNLMMQIPDADAFEPLSTALLQDVKRPVCGILGDNTQSERLIQLLGLADADYMLNRAEGLFALSLDALQQTPFPNNARCIAVNKSHSDLLTGWLSAYNIEALGADDDAALADRVNRTVSRMTTGDADWLLEINGDPVALSGINANLPEVVQIGPVWTPPEHRSRGYARILVAKTLELAKQRGVQKAILFTDNPAAIKAYQAVGFERIGSFRLALLRNEVNL